MKKYELELIKETIDRVDVMKEEVFRGYFFRMLPNSERHYYYLLDFYRRNIFYKYDVNKLKTSKYRFKFHFELNISYALKIYLYILISVIIPFSCSKMQIICRIINYNMEIFVLICDIIFLIVLNF